MISDISSAFSTLTGGVLMAERLGITLVGEGIETAAERDVLRGFDIRYQQGYLFARPAVGVLPLA